MMPIKPFKGKWRRPDLRNHRKLVVVDSKVAFMGSQNMIDSSYLKPNNIKIGQALERSQHQDHRRNRDGARGGLRHGLVHRDRREAGR